MLLLYFKAFCTARTWPVLFAVAQLEPPPSLFAGCERYRLHDALDRHQPAVRKSDAVNKMSTCSTEHTMGLRAALCLVFDASLWRKFDGAVLFRRR